MEKKFEKIFKIVLQNIKPAQLELNSISDITKKFSSLLSSELKKNKIHGNIFVGGSLAKNTIIRKNRYDMDIFARFPYEYADKDKKMSDLLEKALKRVIKRFCHENIRLKLERIHGSRDYFNLNFYNKQLKMPLLLEIVPTLKIIKPQQAKNVTDLSFFHVNYILKQIRRNSKLADEIRLAKAFCYAQNCYGAESYVKGFSGYALELLVTHYGSFKNFIKKVSSWKPQVVIDPAKFYKNKDEILTNINEAKLQSPVVLIDPTFSQRNVCAAVSGGTCTRFIDACKNFLSHPNKECFEKKAVSKEKLRREAKRLKAKFAIIKISTHKEKEDIAAAKLVKFCDFLSYIMEKNSFIIKKKELELIEIKKTIEGRFYILYREPSASAIITGPPLNALEHLVRFKKKYGSCFTDDERVYAKVKRKVKSIWDILKFIKKGHEMKDMQISKIELLK